MKKKKNANPYNPPNPILACKCYGLSWCKRKNERVQYIFNWQPKGRKRKTNGRNKFLAGIQRAQEENERAQCIFSWEPKGQKKKTKGHSTFLAGNLKCTRGKLKGAIHCSRPGTREPGSWNFPGPAPASKKSNYATCKQGPPRKHRLRKVLSQKAPWSRRVWD